MKIEVTLVPDGTDADGEPQFSSLEEAMESAAVGAVEKHIDHAIKIAVRKAVEPAVGAKVDAAIDTIVSAPFQQTDAYGSLKGPEVTFTELLVSKAVSWLSEKVSENGCPERGDRGRTRMEWAAARMCKDEFARATNEQQAKLKALCLEQVSSLVVERFGPRL